MTDKSLMAGSADMMVLKLLENEDMYGYQITDELKRRSQDIFSLKAGTLYPLLHNLEQKGCVSSYDMLHGGRTRKYYKLTDAGREALAGKQAAWKRFSGAVNSVMTEAAYA